MEYGETTEDFSFDDDSKQGKQKKYQARRRIEDWAEYRKMRDDLGWMDDFDTDFSEVY